MPSTGSVCFAQAVFSEGRKVPLLEPEPIQVVSVLEHGTDS